MKHSKSKKFACRDKRKPTHGGRGRGNLAADRRSRGGRDKTAEGIFSGTRNGYGFVEAEGLARDIFIPEGKTRGALDGDRVAVHYHTYQSGETVRTDGEVTRILEAVRTTVIGTVFEEAFVGRGHQRRPRYLVEPSDTHFSREVVLDSAEGVRVGDKVEVTLPPRGGERGELVGTLLRNFGRADSREANYEAILAECGIVTDFSEEALAEAERVAKQPLTEKGRTDRRGEIIFTIDGADAKDLDDAVSLSSLPGGGWRLGVHIADVASYVRPKTALDSAAMERGTSVYFTDKVVPMLPVALSNGACSLNAGEDRYALTCEMEIAPDGRLLRSHIGRSLIRSRVRGVYTEVNDLLERGEGSSFYEKYRSVYPTLREMHRLYTVLAEKSRLRGALDLEQTEAKILLDEDGFPAEILPRTRGDAEKMIEQFMLAANESVAVCLFEQELPCVYRVHEKPSAEKLAEFALFAHNLGFDASFITEKEPAGCDFSRLLDEAKERGLGQALSYTLLRTMAKAHYSEVCHPHFGLGIDRYCHFTSPIRRLSDLATHRMIEAVLLDGESRGRYASYARRAALAASETELKALGAERRIDALYKTLYLSRRLGEIYPATVSSVTRFGVFAALDNTCEGLIPLTDLPGMWFFDEGNMNVRGSAGETLCLGDRISVRVEEADIARGKVRFSLVSLPERTETPAGNAAPSAKRTAMGKGTPRGTAPRPRGAAKGAAKVSGSKKASGSNPRGSKKASGSNPRGGKKAGGAGKAGQAGKRPTSGRDARKNSGTPDKKGGNPPARPAAGKGTPAHRGTRGKR